MLKTNIVVRLPELVTWRTTMLKEEGNHNVVSPIAIKCRIVLLEERFASTIAITMRLFKLQGQMDYVAN